MTTRITRATTAILGVLGLILTACGTGGEDSAVEGLTETTAAVATADDGGGSDDSTIEVPTIVVTTNILGDVVSEVLGDSAEVITIIPFGADPHDFQPSAREVNELMGADALIVNGGAYEEGFLDVIETATKEGVPTFEALDAVSTIQYGDDEHDDEHNDEHDDEHDHSGEDPHFFTDPVRMAVAVDGIVEYLHDTVEFVDPEAVDASADTYLTALNALDADIAEMMAGLAEDRRVLVTNHQVFGYFADRYDFEVIGAVIPSGTTLDTTSGGELDRLAELIEAASVRTIFSDTSASDELIQTLAAEVGDVDVVALYTESLGQRGSAGGTYLDMVRTNAERIVEALN